MTDDNEAEFLRKAEEKTAADLRSILRSDEGLDALIPFAERKSIDPFEMMAGMEESIGIASWVRTQINTCALALLRNEGSVLATPPFEPTQHTFISIILFACKEANHFLSEIGPDSERIVAMWVDSEPATNNADIGCPGASC